ncbi:tape measure protein [Shinella sp. M27]|uniref:tape measure protein n=1 Tax=Shinella sp. M27 TaxID=3368614 RepID=UPI003BA27688
MADIEKLVVQLSADIKQYQREIQRAKAITNVQAREIENRYRQMDSRLSAIGSSSARALVAPLSGIAAALSVREVVSYAEAWTRAQNSLAVAGISAGRQADVLTQLYQLSLDNAAPLEATVELYGRAAMAAENLGARQSDLMRLA